MKIDDTYVFDSNDLEDFITIYHSNGWMEHNQEKIKTIFNASTHIVVAKHNGSAIGLARAVSDDVFNAAIYDVIVDQSYQNHGIGYGLVCRMIKQLEQVSCVHLISTHGVEGLYQKLGFRKLKTGMGIYANQKLKDEYTD